MAYRVAFALGKRRHLRGAKKGQKPVGTCVVKKIDKRIDGSTIKKRELVDLGQRIKALRKALGLTQTQLAAEFGASDNSIISKWERGEQGPSAANLAILANMAGVTAGYFLGQESIGTVTPPTTGRTVSMVGEVQAGEWREAIEWAPDDWFPVGLPPMIGGSSANLRGFVVRGDSMNNRYPDGSYVFVSPILAKGMKLQSGSRVLVTRRDKNGLYEATLKKYVVGADGKKWLWPESSHPEHQAPIQYTEGSEEVAITGIVVGGYLPEILH